MNAILAGKAAALARFAPWRCARTRLVRASAWRTSCTVGAVAFDSRKVAVYRFGVGACLCILAGSILSGPGAMLLVALTHPQPDWRNARLFSSEFHAIQTVPYFLGLILVGGFVALLSSLHAAAPQALKARTASGLVFCSVGAALIFQNYVLQTTFVPALARNFAAEDAPLIAALSMSNPSSFAWGLEMWGYGFIGVATWLSSPVFSEPGLERACAWAFVANGFTSIAGGGWTAISPGWVMTAPGLVAFSVWNGLVVVLVALTLLALRRRAHQELAHAPLTDVRVGVQDV